jgi:phage baseplate assembly protein W|tara:strand:+ start:12950 stop:13333 length:384 start_codon:yes stop_codon:yes gene_type:complete
MSGISPKLPLTIDNVDGPYRLIKNYTALATQNFKMLLLTIPGERIMNPDFGVGLKTYLFEQNVPGTYEAINNRILSQTSKYLPFIKLNKINFSVPEGALDLDPHDLSISIDFTIVPLQTSTTLQIGI